jgi:hypothetical protein
MTAPIREGVEEVCALVRAMAAKKAKMVERILKNDQRLRIDRR